MGKFQGQVVKVETDRFPNGQFAKITNLDVPMAVAVKRGVLESEEYALEVTIDDGSKWVLGASEVRTMTEAEYQSTTKEGRTSQMDFTKPHPADAHPLPTCSFCQLDESWLAAEGPSEYTASWSYLYRITLHLGGIGVKVADALVIAPDSRSAANAAWVAASKLVSGIDPAKTFVLEVARLQERTDVAHNAVMMLDTVH